MGRTGYRTILRSYYGAVRETDFEVRVVGAYGLVYCVGMGNTYVVSRDAVRILRYLGRGGALCWSQLSGLLEDEQEAWVAERLSLALDSLLEAGLIHETRDDVGS